MKLPIQGAKRTLLSLTCASLIAGCASGNGLGAGAPAADQTGGGRQSDTAATTTSKGGVTFSLGITPKRAKPTARKRDYISPSTQSIAIETDGAAPGAVFNLTPSSSNCRANANAPGSYICTLKLSISNGNHVFTLTTYDGTNGSGNVLSTNSTGVVNVKSTGTTVSIALDGIVAYAILSLATTNPPAGSSASIPLTVVLEDADQNIIVGSAPFEYPITLSSTDATDGSLSSTSITSPAGTSGINVAYDGAAVSSITFSASATDLPSGNVTPAVLTPGAASTAPPCTPGMITATSPSTPVLVQCAFGSNSATFASAPAVGDTIVEIIGDIPYYPNPSFGAGLPFSNVYNFLYAADVTASSNASTISSGDPGNTIMWIGEFSGTSTSAISNANGASDNGGGYSTESIAPNAANGLVIADLTDYGTSEASPIGGYTNYFFTTPSTNADANTSNYAQDTELATTGTTDTTDAISLTFSDSNQRPFTAIFQIPPASFTASSSAQARTRARLLSLPTRAQVVEYKKQHPFVRP